MNEETIKNNIEELVAEAIEIFSKKATDGRPNIDVGDIVSVIEEESGPRIVQVDEIESGKYICVDWNSDTPEFLELGRRDISWPLTPRIREELEKNDALLEKLKEKYLH